VTAFRLRKKKETEVEGIRRVAHGRTEDAVERLRDPDADPVEAVHESRKDLKKLRAALKLVRPEVGEEVYDRENGRFRAAGRELSDVRDAQVRAETVDALAERFADDPPPGGWWTVRALIVGGGEVDDADLAAARERTAAEIERGDVAIDEWPLADGGFRLLRPGLKRAYSRARKRYREAREDPSNESLHEFRKRSKDLWYHLRLVREAWPEVLKSAADEAHELSDRLGDDHDLVVLTEYLENEAPALTDAQLDHLRGQIEARRAELQGEAFAYGERLLAEKPKRFVKRIETYWDAREL
jgi:CHAD domain-containing protein